MRSRRREFHVGTFAHSGLLVGAADAALSLDEWERRHRSNVEAALRGKGYRL